MSNSACAAAAAAGTTDQSVQKQTDRRRWAGVFGGRNNSFFAHSMIGIMQMAALSMQIGTQRKRWRKKQKEEEKNWTTTSLRVNCVWCACFDLIWMPYFDTIDDNSHWWQDQKTDREHSCGFTEKGARRKGLSKKVEHFEIIIIFQKSLFCILVFCLF